MISSDFVIIGTRPLASYFSAIRLMMSNLVLRTGADPFWTVIFGKVPKLRVTMLAVTFFCFALRVRTPTSTNVWILSLRTASAGGMMHHPMKEAAVGVVFTFNFVGALNLW